MSITSQESKTKILCLFQKKTHPNKMSQKNLPQITKHFQAFLQLYNFCQSLQTILTLTQLSTDHKHLNSIKTSFDDQKPVFRR